jgi:hypothetical protein
LRSPLKVCSMCRYLRNSTRVTSSP